jgi:hypothetical protein
MADADIDVIIEQLLLLDLDQFCLGLIWIELTGLDIHKSRVVNAMHISIVH